MIVFECSVCGHLEFNEAPEKCLICKAGKASFLEKSDAIKKPVDSTKLTEAEKKHIPQIVVVKECGLIPDATCTDVHVKVGEIEHVMQEEHFIRYIDYYLNYKFVSRIWLSPEVCHPASGLHLKADAGTLTAVENCNVHGNWMSETAL